MASSSPSHRRPRRRWPAWLVLPGLAMLISFRRLGLRLAWLRGRCGRNALPVTSGILGLLAMLLLLGSQFWSSWQRAKAGPPRPTIAQAVAEERIEESEFAEPEIEPALRFAELPKDEFGKETFSATTVKQPDEYASEFTWSASKPDTPADDRDPFLAEEPEPLTAAAIEEAGEDWFGADDRFEMTEPAPTTDLSNEPLFDASEPFPTETMPPDDPFVLDIPEPQRLPPADPFVVDTPAEPAPAVEAESEPFVFTPTLPAQTTTEPPADALPTFAEQPRVVDKANPPFEPDFPRGELSEPVLDVSIEAEDEHFAVRSRESMPAVELEPAIGPDRVWVDENAGWQMSHGHPARSPVATVIEPQVKSLSVAQTPVTTFVQAEPEPPRREPIAALDIERPEPEPAPAERPLVEPVSPQTSVPTPRTTTPVAPPRVEPIAPLTSPRPAPQVERPIDQRAPAQDAPVSRPIAPRPQVAVRVESPPSATVQEQYRYRFEVTNTGDVALTGVVLRVDLPDELHNPFGRRLDYQVGRLLPGATHRARLTVEPRRAVSAVIQVEVISREGAADRTSRTVRVDPSRPNTTIDRGTGATRDALCLPLLTQPARR